MAMSLWLSLFEVRKCLRYQRLSEVKRFLRHSLKSEQLKMGRMEWTWWCFEKARLGWKWFWKSKMLRTTDCDVCGPELQIGVSNNGAFLQQRKGRCCCESSKGGDGRQAALWSAVTCRPPKCLILSIILWWTWSWRGLDIASLKAWVSVFARTQI